MHPDSQEISDPPAVPTGRRPTRSMPALAGMGLLSVSLIEVFVSALLVAALAIGVAKGLDSEPSESSSPAVEKAVWLNLNLE